LVRVHGETDTEYGVLRGILANAGKIEQRVNPEQVRLVFIADSRVHQNGRGPDGPG